MLIRVISGGQTGVDEAALVAAKTSRLATGGYMPKGFRRLDGNHPEFQQLYGMLEDQEPGYKHRTWQNVLLADGTIRIAKNFDSPGEKCTLNAIKYYNRKHLDIPDRFIRNKEDIRTTCMVLDTWLRVNNIEVLNVAGNSEQSAPGIFIVARDFLLTMFKFLMDVDMR